MTDKISNICIDFGTSNTVISYIENNNVKQVLDILNGDSLISSSICFEETIFDKKISELVPYEDYIIGNDAKQKQNELYFYEFKRFLGISKKSESIYKDFLDRYLYNYELGYDLLYFVLEKDDKKVKISIIELVRLYFKGLYLLLKRYFNITGNITIILTCPAYFNDLQRNQLKISVDKTGFEIYKIFNEPTTAVIYYIDYMNKMNKINNKQNKELTQEFTQSLTEITKKDVENGNNLFIVYDIGGGTIDVTVVRYMNDDNICEVIDIDGNSSLGGIDINELLKEHIYVKYKIDSSNKKWKQKMNKYTEEIKVNLSFKDSFKKILEDVPIKDILTNKTNIVEELNIQITRHEFNDLINKTVDNFLEPFKRIYEKYETNNIILIGGPHKIPLIYQKVCLITNNKAKIIDDKENNNINIYKTIVSQGGSILYNYIKTQNLYILDIVPMNIGICDGNNNMIVMIEKNKKIPISIEKTFTTNYDCQRIIDVEIYEGNKINCKDNILIGSYQITGIPSQKRGTILIKLKFSINNNGILNISVAGKEVIDEKTGKGGNFKIDDTIKIIPTSIRNDLIKKLISKKKSLSLENNNKL